MFWEDYDLAHKIQEASELTYRAFVSEVGKGYRNGERAIIKEIVYKDIIRYIEKHDDFILLWKM